MPDILVPYDKRLVKGAPPGRPRPAALIEVWSPWPLGSRPEVGNLGRRGPDACKGAGAW